MSPSMDQMMNGDGFRFYRYVDEAGETHDLLGVTSIRSLCGEGYQLVAWKMANLADAALGTQKRVVIGPRGGVSEKRQVFEFPSQFVKDYLASDGSQEAIDKLRKRLREDADEPRNVAAVRGTMVHEAIERGIQWDRIERPYVESAYASLSSRDRAKIKRLINDDDVAFVRNGVRQYWDLRANVPMVILAREVRVLNLTAGYAGTFDALVWLAGTFNEEGKFTRLPNAVVAKIAATRAEGVTVDTVAQIGGTIALIDWKTSTDVHTDAVVQAHAYMDAEFAVVNGVKDARLTALLEAAHYGGIAHVRPNKWGLYLFKHKPEVVQAFLGSLFFARLLARYPKPTAIFASTFEGRSTEEADIADD